MEKDQIVLLEDRGLLSIIGDDSKSFLQNIISNDVEKISLSNTLFSALLTAQGKYLFEFLKLSNVVSKILMIPLIFGVIINLIRVCFLTGING